MGGWTRTPQFLRGKTDCYRISFPRLMYPQLVLTGSCVSSLMRTDETSQNSLFTH